MTAKMSHRTNVGMGKNTMDPKQHDYADRDANPPVSMLVVQFSSTEKAITARNPQSSSCRTVSNQGQHLVQQDTRM